MTWVLLETLPEAWGGPPGPRPTPPSACSHVVVLMPVSRRRVRGTRADLGVRPTIPGSAPFVLPDTAGLGAHHGLARFAREGFGEFLHVPDYAVDPVLFRRVRVGDGAGALALGAFFAAVPLGKADKETLLRGKASDGL